MTSRTPPRTVLRGSAAIAVAMAVMNVSTYAFTILAARLLGPVDYGALAAVMGLLLVLNVLSLGLQATGARRVAATPEELPRIEHEVLRTTYLCALGLGVLALMATPVVSALLNLDSWSTAALVAVTVVPLTVMGGQAGLLQGERRWTPLAGIYLGMGVGRLAFGALALAVAPGELGAMVGVTAGAVVPALVGAWALRHPSRRPGPGPHPPKGRPESLWAPGGVLRETALNSHALLAFFALSNADVVLARGVLDERDAGLYAAGLILTKAVLFLPQFVVVIVFPSMSGRDSARRMNLIALAAVFAIGMCTVLGVALLSDLAVAFVGGSQYADLSGLLWAFAGLGTLLAMIQLMVYNVVARQRQRSVWFIWLAMAALVVAAPWLESVQALLTTVLVVDSLLFGTLLVLAGRRPGSTAATD